MSEWQDEKRDHDVLWAAHGRLECIHGFMYAQCRCFGHSGNHTKLVSCLIIPKHAQKLEKTLEVAGRAQRLRAIQSYGVKRSSDRVLADVINLSPDGVFDAEEQDELQDIIEQQRWELTQKDVELQEAKQQISDLTKGGLRQIARDTWSLLVLWLRLLAETKDK
jgi:hypothetical protein